MRRAADVDKYTPGSGRVRVVYLPLVSLRRDTPPSPTLPPCAAQARFYLLAAVCAASRLRRHGASPSLQRRVALCPRHDAME